MNKLSKAKIALLERAYTAEVDSALRKCANVVKSKSRTAQELAEEGLLLHARVVWHGAIIEGFRLSDLGKIAYCEHCKPELNPF